MSDTPLDDAQFELNLAIEFRDYDRAERMERIKSALQVCAGSRTTIERLTKENAEYRHIIELARLEHRGDEATINSLAAELAKAREALEPFAKFFKSDEHDLSPAADDTPVAVFQDQKSGVPLASIHIGDFRRARAALPATPEPQPCFDARISDETKEALDAIDDAQRAAASMGHLIVGKPLPAPTVSGEPVAWQHRFRTGLNMDGPWGGWRNGRAAMHEVQSYYQERPLFAHPAPTRDDVLDEAAKIGDQVASEQYQKAGYKENVHTYSMIADGACEVSLRIRSLKGGKS